MINEGRFNEEKLYKTICNILNLISAIIPLLLFSGCM